RPERQARSRMEGYVMELRAHSSDRSFVPPVGGQGNNGNVPGERPIGSNDTIEARSARVAEMMVRYLGDTIVAGFDDDDVTEIYVNPEDGRIRFDTRSRGKVDTGSRIGAARVEQFLNAVADLHGITLCGEHPSIQAELPMERFRGAR